MKKIWFLTLSLVCYLGAFAQPGSVKLLNSLGVEVSTHASINEAYSAIPDPVTQAYTVELQSGYIGSSETIPLILGLKTGTSASNTITIRPAAGFTTLSLSAAAAGVGLIQLQDADWLILDGRPGGTGSTRAISLNNTGTSSNTATITLTNGATNNIIRYINLSNGGTTSGSRNIFFGASAANTSGNSFNRIEYCLLTGSRYGINSSGTAANPNAGNVIFGNEITTVIFSGIWGQGGTTSMVIDSNTISSTNTVGNGPYGILFDSQTDTVVIRRNRIFDINNGTATSLVKGIAIRSTLASASNNYTEITNNMISLSLPNGSSTNVVGIEYSGVNLVNARIWHNTVLVGGTLNSGGVSGNVVSAAFLKTASNITSSYEVKNNLFLSTRTGGNAGAQHVAIVLNNDSGNLAFDYNTYNAALSIGRVGTTLANTLPDFIAALGSSQESNGNTAAVQLISGTDLHLTGTSAGNLALGGISNVNIPTDIDGNFRSTIPYRGADETTPSLGGGGCSGTPNRGNINSPATLYCANTPPITLRHLQGSTGVGVSLLWQVSTDNISFTTIGTGTADSLVISPAVTSWYRVQTNCAISGLSALSDTVQIEANNRPAVGTLTFNNTERNYTFNLTNSARADQFVWNFGDGSPEVTTTVPTATYNYPQSGSYTLRIRAENNCGVDSVQLSFTITVSTDKLEIPVLNLYPNPVADYLTIESGSVLQLIRLFDLQGKLIATYPVDTEMVRLGLSDLGIGIYMAEITDVNGRRSFRRLVKD